MKPNKACNTDRYAPYPGEYQPLFCDTNKTINELSNPTATICKPSANISEFTDHYNVEIIAPGHSREDFVIKLDKNRLSVVAIQPKIIVEHKNYHLQEFDFEYFSYFIEVPGNIDADFISARYNSGILSICFFKTATSTSNTVHNIIVY